MILLQLMAVAIVSVVMLKKQLVLTLAFVNQNELQVKLTLLAKTEHSRNYN